jgi:hypothetical protein
MAIQVSAEEYNYVQRLFSYENLHPSPAWPLTQWTGNADSLEAAVVGAPDYDPTTTAGDALGWQQGYGNYVLDFGYVFSEAVTLWHFGGINWSGEANNLVFLRVSDDGASWSEAVQLRDVAPGGNELFMDTYALDAFGVTAARYLKIEKISGGAKTGKFIDAVGVPPESGGVNRPPVAYAGSNLSADPGEEVILDASGSSDPDGADDLYAYHWAQTGGRAVDPTAANTVTPFFNLPADAVHGELFEFTLTVTDRGGLTATDSVTVMAVTQHPPVARAGLDQRVKAGTRVTLSAATSSDPDEDIVTFRWEQTAGQAVVLSDTGAVSPGFTAPEAVGMSLVFTLNITDATGLSSQDTVTITTVDYAPVYADRVYAESGCKSWVSRGPDQAQGALGPPDYDPADPGNRASGWDNNAGQMTLLFQRAFTTGEGHDLAVHNFGPGSAAVAVSCDGQEWISLGDLPVGSAGGETLHSHRFDLDTYGLSDARLQLVKIEKPVGGANTGRFIDAVEAYHAQEPGDHAPVAVILAADAADPGQAVILDGSRSFDPDGDLAGYVWEQAGGPAVAVVDGDGAEAYFNIPVDAVEGTAFDFRLTVTDARGHSDAGTISVTVTVNHPPVADAGRDQKLMQGKRLRLDGSGSTDADPGDAIVQYQWVQVAGPDLNFSAEAARPLLELPADGAGEVLIFQLTVTDGGGLTASDTVKVTLVDYDPIFADAVLDQSGSKSWSTRAPDGGLNALGAPDYDREVDGDQLSGWNYNNGQITLAFRKPFTNQAGADFRIYHFGPGPAEIYVSGDGDSWLGPVALPPTVSGGGDYYTQDAFDLDTFDTAAAQFVRIVQTRSGKKTGRFIDAVEGFSPESGPDSLTVLEGTTCRLGEGAPEVNLIDTETDQIRWEAADDALSVSAAEALSPSFVAPPVTVDERREFSFSLTINASTTPYYQVRYTILDNQVSEAHLPDGVMPMETPTEKRVGIDHAGDLVALSLLSDTDGSIPDLPLKPRNFVYGLFEVAQKVTAPGEAGEVVIHFTTPLSEDYGWFAYNDEDGWFLFERGADLAVDGAAYSENRTHVSLRITDGSSFDSDGKADGIITSITGPALEGSQAVWLDKGGGEGGCFLRTLHSRMRLRQ